MSTFEVKKRDGLARIAVYSRGEQEIRLPCAMDTEILFPDLADRAFSNVPLAAPQSFASAWLSPGKDQPVLVHPAIPPSVSSGDCVMAGNWNSVLDNPRGYTDWLVRLKEQIPSDSAWYAPGAALPSNVHLLCYSGFDLFDFIAVDLQTARHRFCLPEGEFPASVMDTGVCGCTGCRDGDLGMHNRLALQRELGLVSYFIGDQQLREFVEARSRMHAAHVAILRHLDRHYPFLEQHLPVARACRLGAMSGEALKRPEVVRFADRVLHRYLPPAADVAVLLPCSARKPYSASQSHRKFAEAIGGRALELIVTSPLGLVPREIERIYPAAHYDIPVTGYWDHEERYQITRTLVRYFTRHPYRRVIAHLDGDARIIAQDAADQAGFEIEFSCRSERLTDHNSLQALSETLAGERKVKSHLVRGMISFQFGYDLKVPNLEVKGSYPDQVVKRGRILYFTTNPSLGMLRPTFDGWSLIETGYRVYIDDFVPQGDILAPGVIDADPVIRPGDEVLVIGDKAMATGRAVMSADEMVRSSRGIAVRVRKVKKLDG